MKNDKLKQVQQFIHGVNRLLNEYWVYVNDISCQRYFEYDAIYKIDYQARDLLVSCQEWMLQNSIDFSKLWKSSLGLNPKMQPIVTELNECFLKTYFYDLDDVNVSGENFEGYYYFINICKLNILLPYYLAFYLMKNNQIKLDTLSFHLATTLSLFEKYDIVIDKVKNFCEEGQKKLLFSNFSFSLFFDLLDNLSNLSLFVTSEATVAKKIAFKCRVYTKKSLLLLISFIVIIIAIIVISSVLI